MGLTLTGVGCSLSSASPGKPRHGPRLLEGPMVRDQRLPDSGVGRREPILIPTLTTKARTAGLESVSPEEFKELRTPHCISAHRPMATLGQVLLISTHRGTARSGHRGAAQSSVSRGQATGRGKTAKQRRRRRCGSGSSAWNVHSPWGR